MTDVTPAMPSTTGTFIDYIVPFAVALASAIGLLTPVVIMLFSRLKEIKSSSAANSQKLANQDAVLAKIETKADGLAHAIGGIAQTDADARLAKAQQPVPTPVVVTPAAPVLPGVAPTVPAEQGK